VGWAVRRAGCPALAYYAQRDPTADTLCARVRDGP
jgi:hypothetical protein